MNVNSVSVSSFVLPSRKVAKVRPTVLIGPYGSNVVLKKNNPPNLQKYSNLIGVYQGQVGEYAQVEFEGHGTVSIKSSFLLVI